MRACCCGLVCDTTPLLLGQVFAETNYYKVRNATPALVAGNEFWYSLMQSAASATVAPANVDFVALSGRTTRSTTRGVAALVVPLCPPTLLLPRIPQQRLCWRWQSQSCHLR